MARKRVSENPVVVSPGAAAPVRRSSATAKRTPRAAAVVESSATAEPSPALVESEAVTAPSHDEIATLAYSYWESRGYQGGSPEQDWLRAEQELCSGTGR